MLHVATMFIFVCVKYEKINFFLIHLVEGGIVACTHFFFHPAYDYFCKIILAEKIPQRVFCINAKRIEVDSE